MSLLNEHGKSKFVGKADPLSTIRNKLIAQGDPKLSLGKNTFRYSGSILFNKLPRTLKGATSLSNFKNLLKQYFSR